MKVDVKAVRRWKKLSELVKISITSISESQNMCQDNLEVFMNDVCWEVTYHIDELQLPDDSFDVITMVHNWVKTYFDDYITNEYYRIIREQC
jgi:ubiquinone/menaquinone biosynthesis C-methylase UbiE